MDWDAKLAWAVGEHEQRLATVSGKDEREDFRLAGIAGSSWAAGLSALMAGSTAEARKWLMRAADEYAASWDLAPAGSWGRPIAMIRCRLIAEDHDGARADARAAVSAGALDAPGPIGAYCAALALSVLGRHGEAAVAASRAADEGLEPTAVAEALGAVARASSEGYAAARSGVLRSFEERDAFLEDVRVADTVLVLDTLARERGLEPPAVPSELLPG